MDTRVHEGIVKQPNFQMIPLLRMQTLTIHTRSRAPNATFPSFLFAPPLSTCTRPKDTRLRVPTLTFQNVPFLLRLRTFQHPKGIRLRVPIVALPGDLRGLHAHMFGRSMGTHFLATKSKFPSVLLLLLLHMYDYPRSHRSMNIRLRGPTLKCASVHAQLQFYMSMNPTDICFHAAKSMYLKTFLAKNSIKKKTYLVGLPRLQRNTLPHSIDVVLWWGHWPILVALYIRSWWLHKQKCEAKLGFFCYCARSELLLFPWVTGVRK